MSKLLSPVDGYIDALCAIAENHSSIIVMDADNCKSTRTIRFKEAYPRKFIDVGIAEQNLIGVAAGLAQAGKTVFANTFACFIASKAFDIIRMSVALPKTNVKIVGCSGGLQLGAAGASHHALEDIGLMRMLPNMGVIVPADFHEARQVTYFLSETKGPFYVRVGRESSSPITSGTKDFTFGRAAVILDGYDVTICACGVMVSRAILAAQAMLNQGISAAVLNFSTIKPLDSETLIHYAKRTGAVVVAEEHNMYGGLSDAVCQALARFYPIPVEVVAIGDVFCESGPTEQQYEKYGLTAEAIIQAALAVMSKRKLA